MGVDILGFAYAATVAAGGIMGYAKAGQGLEKSMCRVKRYQTLPNVIILKNTNYLAGFTTVESSCQLV
ncbi:hypothetical protein RR48_11254 [Papilio machaon]|uniref:Uncharacterized protein n=1 Tax=Papilio machaon TaxID=76193 RepID=A0A194QQB4_PAPMA|nr:hypothetical protein RR48_11254 [Papilio machaon]